MTDPIQEAADHLAAAGFQGPRTLLLLGSGLSGLVGAMEDPREIPYAAIPGFPTSTAPGHKGRLLRGRLAGRDLLAMDGRFHLYEGWTAAQIAHPIRTLARLGTGTLIVTNAAGALDPAFEPGEVMLIEDHLNLTGVSPLTGPNDDRVGLRFPDMSRAYDPTLRAQALAAADRLGLPLRRGVYVGIPGPALETSAERRFLRMAGGDAVGMSTVTEVVAAVHAGLRVLGLSAITNKATGGPDQEPDTIEAVLANAAVAGRAMSRLLHALLADALP